MKKFTATVLAVNVTDVTYTICRACGKQVPSGGVKTFCGHCDKVVLPNELTKAYRIPVTLETNDKLVHCVAFDKIGQQLVGCSAERLDSDESREKVLRTLEMCMVGVSAVVTTKERERRGTYVPEPIITMLEPMEALTAPFSIVHSPEQNNHTSAVKGSSNSASFTFESSALSSAKKRRLSVEAAGAK